MGEVFTALSKKVLLQEYPQGDLKFLRNHYVFLRTQKCKHFQIFYTSYTELQFREGHYP